MRIMPFMKRKKGIQFAGVGLDTGGGGGSHLPVATSETLGGVKIGNGVNVTQDGVISVSGGLVDFTSEEQPLGIKWIDGKDLFVKTFSGTKTDPTFTFNIDNVDFVYPICAYLEQSGGTLLYPYYKTGTSYFYMLCQLNGNNRKVYLESSHTNIPYHITFIYTKR